MQIHFVWKTLDANMFRMENVKCKYISEIKCPDSPINPFHTSSLAIYPLKITKNLFIMSSRDIERD